MVTDQLLLGVVIGPLPVYSLACLLGRQWAAATDSRRDEQVETDEMGHGPNCEMVSSSSSAPSFVWR